MADSSWQLRAAAAAAAAAAQPRGVLGEDVVVLIGEDPLQDGVQGLRDQILGLHEAAVFGWRRTATQAEEIIRRGSSFIYSNVLKGMKSEGRTGNELMFSL